MKNRKNNKVHVRTTGRYMSKNGTLHPASNLEQRRWRVVFLWLQFIFFVNIKKTLTCTYKNNVLSFPLGKLISTVHHSKQCPKIGVANGKIRDSPRP